jgi:hypothetical protein
MKVTYVALISGLLLLAASPASLASRSLAQAGNGIGSQAASAAGNALGLPRIPGTGSGSGSGLPGLGGLASGAQGGLNNVTGRLRDAMTGLTERLGLNGTNATSLERCIATLDSYNITLINGTTGEPITGANATGTGANATAPGNATVSACS